MPQHHLDVALIDETKKVTFKELSRARAVLQKRLRRDLAPIWGVSATIELYRDSRDAPRELRRSECGTSPVQSPETSGLRQFTQQYRRKHPPIEQVPSMA